MLVIGLTGRSGSGKSVVAACASKIGFRVVDCDDLYHKMTSYMSPFLCAIKKKFGDAVVASSALNRQALRDIVFRDADKLAELNHLTSVYMSKELLKMIKCCKKENVSLLLDAPTLLETGIDSICDVVVSVICPVELCKSHIVGRDGISPEDADLRLNNQKENAFYIENSDYLIYNDDSLESLEKNAEIVLKQILQEVCNEE